MKQSIGSGRGSVYNIIMKALQSGDKYGYEICQEVEQKTNGNYILKQPSLYSGLKRLESQKLVESYWGDSDIGGRRHYYRLTEQGRRKIEQTNFSWEDERNDLVDSMFQKSELEKNIDNIKEDLQDAKSSLFDAQKTNEQLSQAINSPAPQTDNKTFGHKVNENQFDLFSFADLSNKKNEEAQQEIATQPKMEEIKQPEREEKGEPQNIVEQKEEKLIEEKTLKQEEVSVGEKLNSKINFDDFMNQSSTSFYENKEEKSTTPVSFEDLDRTSDFMGSFNNSTMQETAVKKDNFDELYEKFQKSFEEQSKTNEEPKKEENFFDQTEQERLMQERRMSEALSGNLNAPKVDENLHKVEILDSSLVNANINSQEIQADSTQNSQTFEKYENKEFEQSQVPSSTMRQINDKNTNLTEDLGFTKDFVDNFNNINFKSIFGDVYDDSDKQSLIAKTEQVAEPEQVEQVVRKNNDQSLAHEYMNNINLSLDSSKYSSTKAYNQEQNSNYKNFEQNYYDKINTTNSNDLSFNEKATISQTEAQYNSNNLSFDKKCENHGYNFSDYEIRYLRKNVPEIKTSKFTRIGKLNFTSSMILSLIAIALILTFSLVKEQQFILVNNQELFMLANASVIGLFMIIEIASYSYSKYKRVIYKFETKRFLLNLIVAVVGFGLLFLFNNLSGMTLKTIGNYCFSFVVPSCLLILYATMPILNKIFSKLPYYAK